MNAIILQVLAGFVVPVIIGMQIGLIIALFQPLNFDVERLLLKWSWMPLAFLALSAIAPLLACKNAAMWYVANLEFRILGLASFCVLAEQLWEWHRRNFAQGLYWQKTPTLIFWVMMANLRICLAVFFLTACVVAYRYPTKAVEYCRRQASFLGSSWLLILMLGASIPTQLVLMKLVNFPIALYVMFRVVKKIKQAKRNLLASNELKKDVDAGEALNYEQLKKIVSHLYANIKVGGTSLKDDFEEHKLGVGPGGTDFPQFNKAKEFRSVNPFHYDRYDMETFVKSLHQLLQQKKRDPKVFRERLQKYAAAVVHDATTLGSCKVGQKELLGSLIAGDMSGRSMLKQFYKWNREKNAMNMVNPVEGAALRNQKKGTNVHDVERVTIVDFRGQIFCDDISKRLQEMRPALLKAAAFKVQGKELLSADFIVEVVKTLDTLIPEHLLSSEEESKKALKGKGLIEELYPLFAFKESWKEEEDKELYVRGCYVQVFKEQRKTLAEVYELPLELVEAVYPVIEEGQEGESNNIGFWEEDSKKLDEIVKRFFQGKSPVEGDEDDRWKILDDKGVLIPSEQEIIDYSEEPVAPKLEALLQELKKSHIREEVAIAKVFGEGTENVKDNDVVQASEFHDKGAELREGAAGMSIGNGNGNGNDAVRGSPEAYLGP
jgi:hypothetical protein